MTWLIRCRWRDIESSCKKILVISLLCLCFVPVLTISCTHFQTFVFNHYLSCITVYVHPTKGGGDILLLVRILSASASASASSSFLSALYLLNQSVDFDQTVTDTLLGLEKEVIRFRWPWPHFQSHTSILNYQILTKKCVCALSLQLNDGFGPNSMYRNAGMV